MNDDEYGPTEAEYGAWNAIAGMVIIVVAVLVLVNVAEWLWG